MSLFLQLTDSERDSRQWQPQHLQQAYETFVTQGCLVLQNVLPRNFVQTLSQAYATRPPKVAGESRWNRSVPVGPGRGITTLPLQAPFDQPDFFAHPLLCALLDLLLAPDFVLSSCSVVLAGPGAAVQRHHRDINLLYGGSRMSLMLPVYALTVGLPLLDLTDETGTTALYAGSHLEILHERVYAREPVTPRLQMGDVYFFDCRLIHHGTPNTSSQGRPIVYLTYTRSWFLDDENLLETLIADPEVLRRVPASHPRLLSRTRLSASRQEAP